MPILLAWCCHGITSGATCATHPSAHQSQGPRVPVPAPPLSCAWQHPGVHLDPSRFHCLSAHHHPSNHPSQPATIPLLAHPNAATKHSSPVLTAGADLVAWQAMVVAMALQRLYAPYLCPAWKGDTMPAAPDHPQLLITARVSMPRLCLLPWHHAHSPSGAHRPPAPPASPLFCKPLCKTGVPRAQGSTGWAHSAWTVPTLPANLAGHRCQDEGPPLPPSHPPCP